MASKHTVFVRVIEARNRASAGGSKYHLHLKVIQLGFGISRFLKEAETMCSMHSCHFQQKHHLLTQLFFVVPPLALRWEPRIAYR